MTFENNLPRVFLLFFKVTNSLARLFTILYLQNSLGPSSGPWAVGTSHAKPAAAVAQGLAVRAACEAQLRGPISIPLRVVKLLIQGEITYAPPPPLLPPISGQGIFRGKGVGVYILSLHKAGILYAPIPRKPENQK